MPQSVPSPQNDDEVALCYIWKVAGVPVDGTSGTGAGRAPKGSLAIDYTNGNLYVNGGAGTKASPVWKLVTKAA